MDNRDELKGSFREFMVLRWGRPLRRLGLSGEQSVRTLPKGGCAGRVAVSIVGMDKEAILAVLFRELDLGDTTSIARGQDHTRPRHQVNDRRGHGRCHNQRREEESEDVSAKPGCLKERQRRHALQSVKPTWPSRVLRTAASTTWGDRTLVGRSKLATLGCSQASAVAC